MRAASLVFALVACSLTATAHAAPLFTPPSPPKIVWSRAAGAEAVAISPDGRFIASGGLQRGDRGALGRVDVWSTSDGAHLGHAESHGEAGLIGYTEDLAFSPDGLTLATSHGSTPAASGGRLPDRPGLFQWTVPALEPGAGRVDLTPASAVCFSPDGSQIAVSYIADRAVAGRTHGATDLATLQEMAGHHDRVNDVEWSPDGALIASVADDGYLRAWIAETGTLVLTLFHGDPEQGGEPVSVAFSPDGALIATAGAGSALRTKLWRVSDGKLLHDLESQITPDSYGRNVVAFTPNGSYLVGGFQQFVTGESWRGRIRFWSVASGEIVEEYAESGAAPHHGGVTSLAFSPGQDHRFAYTVRGQVKLAETELALASAVPAPSSPKRARVTPKPVLSSPAKAAIPSAEDASPAKAAIAPAEDASPAKAAIASAEDIRVGEARPNAARSQVALTIEVANALDVRAGLFDALGRKVASVFEGRLHPGEPEELSFDSRALASGRYEIRIESESGTVTRAVSLVR